MTSTQSILASILTSGAVSTLIIVVFRSWVESRIRYRYQVDLEKLKNELMLHLEATRSLLEQRLAVYPQMTALAYQVRNLARGIACSGASTLMDPGDLPRIVLKLEQTLYVNVFYLMQDEIFEPVHEFKNSAISFVQLVDDFRRASDDEFPIEAEQVHNQLQERYRVLDEQYQLVVQKFSDILPDWVNLIHPTIEG